MSPKSFLFLFLVTLCTATGIKAQDTLKKTTDTLKSIPDTLLFKIKEAQSTVSQINANNKRGYQIDLLSQRIGQLQQSIATIQKELTKTGHTTEARNLSNYKLMVKDGLTEVDALTKQLSKYNEELRGMSDQVVGLSSDSLLIQTTSNDPDKMLYADQLGDIRNKLQYAGLLNGKSLDTVGKLLAKTSQLNLSLNDLQIKLEEQRQKSGRLALKKEVAYLWEAPLGFFDTTDIGKELRETIQGQSEILQYFIQTTWDKRTMLVLLMLAFFIWVHRNIRYSQRTSVKRKIGTFQFEYIRAWPILSTLIVMICFAPFTQPDAPSIYIELLQISLLALMTIHLWKVLPKKQLQFWILILVVYTILVAIINLAGEGLAIRCLLLLLNIFFAYLAWQLQKKTNIAQLPKKVLRVAIAVVWIFNSLSILLNIFGRVSLAKIFATAGTTSLIQVFGLAVFIQIWLDALELQFKVSECKKGLFSRINQAKTKSQSKKLLILLSILLWTTVLFTNLGLTEYLTEGIQNMLDKPRKIGKIDFNLGNVIYFVGIIYIASKIQKHIPILFGEGQVSFDKTTGHRNSKVALLRLIVIVIGLLLAITALGLPMDRVTVILGALGVGIGLGMQNIVNNFVSGIILIFERPFRIGDYIELVDKKGKVQDIGIRSSKLLTPQGSEVIIPNGDLLAGRLVNWTLSNDYLKSEITVKLNSQFPIEKLTTIIEQEISTCSDIMKNMAPEITIASIGADFIELKILTWINNIYVENNFKTEAYQKLLQRFQKEEIKIM